MLYVLKWKCGHDQRKRKVLVKNVLLKSGVIEEKCTSCLEMCIQVQTENATHIFTVKTVAPKSDTFSKVKELFRATLECFEKVDLKIFRGVQTENSCMSWNVNVIMIPEKIHFAVPENENSFPNANARPTWKNARFWTSEKADLYMFESRLKNAVYSQM